MNIRSHLTTINNVRHLSIKMKARVVRAPIIHNIEPGDVREWSNGRWCDNLCAGISLDLNAMRWANEPPLSQAPPPPQDDPWWDEIDSLATRVKSGAADLEALLGSLSAIGELLERLRHDERLRSELKWMYPDFNPDEAGEAGGRKCVESLEKQLARLHRIISFPWHRKRDHRSKSRPAEWAIPALVVRGIVREAFKSRGLRSPSFAKESAAVDVAFEALRRMGYRRRLTSPQTLAEFFRKSLA